MRAVFNKKSVQTAFFFMVFSVAAAAVPSPFWDGNLLDLVPEPPTALQAPPEEVVLATDAPAAVVDFNELAVDGQLPGADVVAAVEDPNNEEPNSEDVESDQPSANELASAAADARLRDALQGLVGQLGEDNEYLQRPCLRETDSGLCLQRQMDRFFEGLRLTAFQATDEPVRLSQFGDSMIMGDQFCGELRRLLQAQFGDGGHGFLYPGNPKRRFGYENIRVGLASDDAWSVRTIVVNGSRADDLFGFAGAAFRPVGGPTMSLRPNDTAPGDRLERIGLLYFAPSGLEEGSVFVSDGDNPREQRTFPVEGGSSGLHWLDIEAGSERVGLSYFEPRMTWHGIISETGGPGVVVDNVGLVSGRMRFLSKINEEQWADQLRLRGTDLISFNFGGNAAGQSAEAFRSMEESYKQDYQSVFDRLERNNPEIDCLVMGVMTRGQRQGGRVTVYGAIREIARAQQEIATQNGCAYFDLYSLIGGDGGADAWYRHRPQLLGGDLSHPTTAGYREIARNVYIELIYGMIEYLDERAARAEAGHAPL